MKREEILIKFTQLYKDNLSLILDKEEYKNDRDKLRIKCNKCNHSWPASIRNVLVFRSGCYQCCKGKGYSMDEVKILNYIKDNYIPKEHHVSFRYAEDGSQLKIVPSPPKFEPIGMFRAPLFYLCDGYSRITYEYEKETKTLKDVRGNAGTRGTVFEILGDYHHSNPMYYKPDDISPKKGFTHKQNYEYTMNRLKHIEEQGFKVYYIWITDFRRFTRELEKGTNPNIFDYMNIEKKYSLEKPDYSLLSRGTQDMFRKNDFAEF